jgi:hypothetical protein
MSRRAWSMGLVLWGRGKREEGAGGETGGHTLRPDEGKLDLKDKTNWGVLVRQDRRSSGLSWDHEGGGGNTANWKPNRFYGSIDRSIERSAANRASQFKPSRFFICNRHRAVIRTVGMTMTKTKGRGV